MTKRTKYRILTICIMLFIFVQSALPADLSGAESSVIVDFLVRTLGLPQEGLTFFVRKMAHFTEYLILGISLCLSVKHERLTFFEAALAWGIGAIYGVTDEFHQYFVVGRSCEFRDMCIDAAGVLTGCLVQLILSRGEPSPLARQRGEID